MVGGDEPSSSIKEVISWIPDALTTALQDLVPSSWPDQLKLTCTITYNYKMQNWITSMLREITNSLISRDSYLWDWTRIMSILPATHRGHLKYAFTVINKYTQPQIWGLLLLSQVALYVLPQDRVQSCLNFTSSTNFTISRGSSSSIVSIYWMTRVQSLPGVKDFFLASVSRLALRPIQPLIQWVSGVLSSGVKHSWGVTLTNHPHLVPRSRISRSYTFSPTPKCHYGM
jgi:hypothetical protein